MSENDNPTPDLQTWIEPELEARIVAWVLGEASAFEMAELTRIVGEKPELEIFTRRISAVHGLVASAVRPEVERMRLSQERRQKLLEKFGRSESIDAPKLTVIPLQPRGRRVSPRLVLGLAACVAVALVLAGISLPVFSNVQERGAQTKALSEAKQRELSEMRSSGISGPADSKNQVWSAPTTSQTPTAAASKPAEYAKRESGDVSVAAATLATEGPGSEAGKDMADKLADGFDVRSAIANTSGSEMKAEPQMLEQAQAFLTSKTDRLRADAVPMIEHAAQMPATEGLANAQEEQEAASASATQLSQNGSVTNFRSAGGRISNEDTDAQVQSNTYTGTTTINGGTLGVTTAQPAQVDEPQISQKSAEKVNMQFALASAEKAVARLENNSQRAMSLDSLKKDVGEIENPEAVVDEAKQALAQNGPAAAAGFINYGSPISVSGGNTTMSQPMKELESRARELTKAGQGQLAFATGGEISAFAQNKSSVGGAKQRVDAQKQAPADSSETVAALGDIPAIGRTFRRGASLPVLKEKEKAAGDRAKLASVNEIKAADEPFSTFSLHVSDVSFRLAQAALAKGEMPADAIRPEEFYNAFDYGDPSPASGEKVGCRIEQSAHPFLQQRNLVRIAMKVPAAGRGKSQPLRLTVLLDTSGSMEREDRAASVRSAMQVLASLLGPNDRITLIGFSRRPRLLADQVRGDQAGKLVEMIAHTPSEGGTNLEEAIKLASELARQHRVASAQNRIVLLTDGAANLGNADPEQLSAMIEKLRQQGIAFDACGVGADGLNDEILEALTRKGDGRYYLLDKPEDADAGFARQLAGAFRPAAQNVKVQVRFNPARVGSYRLIGFEKHLLKKEDFRNDKVDAAELAAEEAAVALYQVEVLPEGEGEIGEVFVRFRDPADGRPVEQSWTITYDPQARAFDQAAPTMQLAGTAALLAEKLRGGATADLIDLDKLAPIIGRLRGNFPDQTRVQQLAQMFEQMRRMDRKN